MGIDKGRFEEEMTKLSLAITMGWWLGLYLLSLNDGPPFMTFEQARTIGVVLIIETLIIWILERRG